MNKNHKSFQFLCDCISPDLDYSDIQVLKHEIQANKVDWDEVIKRANAHVVVSTLWYGLKSKGLVDSLDQDLHGFLKKFHEMNTQRNRFLKTLLVEIIETLNKIDVEPILFKGSASFFDDLFPDPGIRLMTDLDIIIKKEDLDRSLEEMYKIGYQHDKEEFAKYGKLGDLFKDGEFSNALEFHFSLDKANTPDLIPVKEIWQESSPAEKNGLRFRFLLPTHQIIYHIMHCEVQHGHYYDGIIELRQLHDFAFKLLKHQDNLDWESAQSHMEQFGYRDVFDAYLISTGRLMNIKLPMKNVNSFRSKIHYYRNIAHISWPASFMVIRAIHRFINNFSQENICRQYQCRNSFWAVSYCRLRRLIAILKKFTRLSEFKRLKNYHSRH
ncbi:MAG: nucleotidyltransferase family protein [Proteobacteria bacterium]|nr:nucleotidyltransferase family protein [Pseudomonadota bacterium]